MSDQGEVKQSATFIGMIPDHYMDLRLPEDTTDKEAEIKMIQELRRIMSEKSDEELVEYFGMLAWKE